MAFPSTTRASAEGAEDGIVTGLAALTWIVSEPERAGRLLALTGLDPDDLRARAADPALLAAVLAWLAAHEPDLVACATAIGASPGALVAAGRALA